MPRDPEGYDFRSDERGVDRLLTDFRTLSPAGIERAAWGWNRHADGAAVVAFREAEKAALKAIEANHLTSQWEAGRRTILDLTEGRTSLVAWRAEHGETGHKAERAALGAALAVVAAAHLDRRHFVSLVRPMAEALPWLLPDTPPEPYAP